MTKLEELRQAFEASTPGEWKPCKDHEDFDGEYFDIEPGERAAFDARPITGIEAASGGVARAHDLFEFKTADAQFIALAHSLMPHLLGAVEALNTIKARYNGIWDDPGLLDFGPLSPGAGEDMFKIAHAALEKLK